MTDTLTYENRVLAFVDVLGFSELTRASRNDEGALKKISDLVATDTLFDDFYREVLEFGTATFFSDSFVVSMVPERAWYLFRHTGQLCRYLLVHGLACRGAITAGPLYHRDKVVVGPALVEAYRLERYVAGYPRIILDDSATRLWEWEFRPGGSFPELEVLVKHDGTGNNFIDIFHPRWADSFQPWPDGFDCDHASFMKAALSEIEAGTRTNADNERVRKKYEWLAAEAALSGARA